MDGSRIDRGFGLRSGGIEPLTAARPARPANERDDAMKLWGDARVVRGMRAQLEMRRARPAAGDATIGWKVRFAAPEMLKRLDIAGPLVGFLTRNALVQSGASIPVTGWTKPVAEPENRRLCCPRCFGRRRPGHRQGRNRRDLTGKEMVDLTAPPEDPDRILAGNIYQRHVVLSGDAPARTGSTSDDLVCRILRRGSEFARTSNPQANTGNWVDIVRHVADVLAAFGERLRGGEIIITGSVVAPLAIEPDEDTIAFEVDPVGRVGGQISRL